MDTNLIQPLKKKGSASPAALCTSGIDVTAASPHLSNPINALLIEDNPGDAFLVRRYLKKFLTTLELTQTETLHQAIDLGLQNKKFDLIILDLNLPDSVGLDSFMKVLQSFPQTPIVVLTGVTEREMAQSLLSKGAYAFITKDDMNE